MRNNRKNKRLMKSAWLMAAVPTLAILSVGTFAWQSFSQSITNENTQEMNPGGRLHDDFNGRNKDVYAENYTLKNEDGEPLYVRIRMSEYMEIGADAGDKENADREAKALITGSDISDTSTWKVHTPGDTDSELCTNTPSFHDYWTWELGGSTVYMPTFNKDKDSLDADINGTWASVSDEGKHYDDYEAYTVGKEVTANARYSKDSSTGTEVKDSEGNVLYKELEEIHTAKATQDAEVMTMKEWMDAGSIPGKFWVWDTDGWAYWAEALQPEEATGCLLTGIKQKSYVTGEVYYAIDVTGEFATAYDWGEAGDGVNGTGDGATGFYEKGMTENGKFLLDRIASVIDGQDGKRYLDCGNNTYKQINDDGSLGDLICGGMDEVPGTDDDKTNLVLLAASLYIGEDDYGTLFIGPEANNSYLSVGLDGLLGTDDDIKIWYVGDGTFPGDPISDENFSLIGADELVLEGITEGMEVEPTQTIQLQTTVKLHGAAIENQKVKWYISGGSKGTAVDSKTKVLTIAADEKVGKELTITAKSEEDATHALAIVKVNIAGPDEVSITSDEANVSEGLKMASGKEKTFVATVKRGGNTYLNNQVTWKLTGNESEDTTLVNGTLTVAANEPIGSSLTIEAISVNDTNIKKTITVEVVSLLDSIVPGSEETVEIDGIEFYVLAKDETENKTLLYAKEPVAKSNFGGSNVWSTERVIYSTLQKWLNEQPTLSSHAVETTTYARKVYNAYADEEDYDAVSCKAFLLSEADVFGTIMGQKNKITENNKMYEFTYNGQQLTDNKNIIGFTDTTYGSYAWLRSPSSGSNVQYANKSGTRNSNACSNIYAVRPALWVEGL